MFNNTSFEALTKTFKANAEKFNPAGSQAAFQPVMEQFKAWGELAQKQAVVAQAAVAETVESFKSIKEPQAAFETLKASAENGLAIATKNMKDVAALGISQFQASLDALEKAHPAPEAFAQVGKTLKTAVANMGTAFDSAMKTGAATPAKKSRAA